MPSAMAVPTPSRSRARPGRAERHGGTNTFTVTGWTGTGTLTGGGSDTVVATKTTGNITLTNTSLVTGTMSLTLSGITLDTLTLSNYTGSRVVDASAFTGTSTLTASSTTATARVKLLGGSGNDTLTVSGSGQGILVGNAGNDTLSATGSGRTLLIGGDGADALSSGTNGQAMMIGESTSYDSNLAALDAILNEWASANNYATRISNILSGGGLAGLGYALNSTTVIDDGAVNTLTGPTGGGAARNWFIRKNDWGVRSPRGPPRPSPVVIAKDRAVSTLGGARSTPSGPPPAFVPHGHHRHPCATRAMSEGSPGGTSNADVDPPRNLRALPGARTRLNRATPRDCPTRESCQRREPARSRTRRDRDPGAGTPRRPRHGMAHFGQLAE